MAFDYDLELFSKLSLPMFALYMLMFGNFTNRLLGKKMFDLIANNTIIKHSIAYFNLLFFIILSNERKLDDNLLEIIGFSIIVYALIVMTLTLSPIAIAIIIFMLLLIYIINILIKIREIKKDTVRVKSLTFARDLMSFIAIMMMLIGFSMSLYSSYKNNESIIS